MCQEVEFLQEKLITYETLEGLPLMDGCEMQFELCSRTVNDITAFATTF